MSRSSTACLGLVPCCLAAIGLMAGCGNSGTADTRPSPSASPSVARAGDWRVIASGEKALPGLADATTVDIPYSITAPDSDHAWMVGMDGDILATADGGATWQAQSPDGALGTGATNTADLCSVDSLHVWGVDARGRIRATTDGGVTWTAQQSGVPQLAAAAFCDATNGWAVGGDDVIHTTDGGATWEPQRAPVGPLGLHDGLQDVDCVDTNHAWMVRQKIRVSGEAIRGATGTVYATSDGGKTWIKRWVADIGMAHVDFVDTRNGWVAGGNGIWATTDGGRSWHRQPSAGDRINDISFTDPAHGWAARWGRPAQNGILQSGDGGRTWSFQSLKSLGMWRASWAEDWGIAFSDVEHGWAVGDSGWGQLVARYEPR